MRIEIYKLQNSDAGWQLNLQRPVAVITVADGQGTFQFHDLTQEKALRKLFEKDLTTFMASAVGGGGDALCRRAAWQPETVDYILKECLFAHSLGGRIQ